MTLRGVSWVRSWIPRNLDGLPIKQKLEAQNILGLQYINVWGSNQTGSSSADLVHPEIEVQGLVPFLTWGRFPLTRAPYLLKNGDVDENLGALASRCLAHLFRTFFPSTRNCPNAPSLSLSQTHNTVSEFS